MKRSDHHSMMYVMYFGWLCCSHLHFVMMEEHLAAHHQVYVVYEEYEVCEVHAACFDSVRMELQAELDAEYSSLGRRSGDDEGMNLFDHGD